MRTELGVYVEKRKLIVSSACAAPSAPPRSSAPVAAASILDLAEACMRTSLIQPGPGAEGQSAHGFVRSSGSCADGLGGLRRHRARHPVLVALDGPVGERELRLERPRAVRRARRR